MTACGRCAWCLNDHSPRRRGWELTCPHGYGCCRNCSTCCALAAEVERLHPFGHCADCHHPLPHNAAESRACPRRTVIPDAPVVTAPVPPDRAVVDALLAEVYTAAGVAIWWAAPNRGLDRRCPAELWAGGVEDRARVFAAAERLAGGAA
jgi:hypothetical protein